MFDGYYQISLELNKSLVNLPNVKSTDSKTRGLDIIRTLNGVVQNTAGQAIYLNAMTPSGQAIFQQAEQVDTTLGHYLLTYPNAMLREVGNVSVELMIVDSMGVISTNTGIVVVESAIANYSEIVDEPNYPALLQALNKIQSMEVQVAQMVELLNTPDEPDEPPKIEVFPTGAILISPVVLDIKKWVPLDGRSTGAYPTLIPIYGATLPNANGKVAVQLDSSQTEFNTLGKTGGEKTHDLQVSEIPSHGHKLNMYSSDKEENGHYGALPDWQGGQGFMDRVMVYTTVQSYSSTYLGNEGGGSAHNNLQPYMVLGKYYVHI